MGKLFTSRNFVWMMVLSSLSDGASNSGKTFLKAMCVRPEDILPTMTLFPVVGVVDCALRCRNTSPCEPGSCFGVVFKIEQDGAKMCGKFVSSFAEISYPLFPVCDQDNSVEVYYKQQTKYDSCDTGWTFLRETMSCYWIDKNLRNKWWDAKETCEEKDAHLAKVTSLFQADFIYYTLAEEDTVWLGASRLTNDSFVWHDGCPLTFSNWNSGQPFNHDGYQDCVLALAPARGKWHDDNCGKWYTFVCQREL